MKRSKILITSVFVAGSLIMTLVLSSCGGNADTKLRKELEKTFAEYRSQLPMKLDEYTSLDSMAVTDHREINYYYSLDLSGVALGMAELKENMKNILTTNIRSNREMDDIKAHRVTFIYNYLDTEGRKLFDVRITPEMYE